MQHLSFHTIRRLLATAILGQSPLWASADSVSWEPETPNENDTITVTVDRPNFEGKLHWGVNAGDGAWHKIVPEYAPPGSEFESIAARTAFMQSTSNATVRIGPFNHPAQRIDSIDFAIQLEDGNWENNSGNNYRIPVSHSGVRIAPRTPGLNDIIFIMLEDDRTNAMLRWGVNGGKGGWCAPHQTYWPTESILQGHGVSVETTFPPQSNGVSIIALGPFNNAKQQVESLHFAINWGDVWDNNQGRNYNTTLTRQDAGSSDASTTFTLHPDVVSAEMDPELPHGADVKNDGSTSFRLFAPNKSSVRLVGSFNNWDTNTPPMNLDSKGNWWCTTNLQAGTHEYQYLLDDEFPIADPYSRDVLWITTNQVESSHPNDAHTVLTIPPTPFQWNATDYVRPPLDQLIIYELHIQDFAARGGFTALVERIDYISGLGVNAIELLPVMEFTDNHGWGYNPAFHFAPETAYGTPKELKLLIDRYHDRGIAFIVDMVLNHADKTAPLARLYGSDYIQNPYFQVFHGDNWGFPDIDQKSEHLKRYVADVLAYWIHEYHADGFRYDATRWTGWSGSNDWGASWFAHSAKQEDPTTYQIAEHLPSEPEMILGSPMDSEWDDQFRWRIRDIIKEGKIPEPEAIRHVLNAEKSGYTNALQRMLYIESHDEERLYRELSEKGYSLEERARRMTTAAAILLTTPGIPMIYAGQEFGEDTKKVVGDNPMNWKYTNDPLRRKMIQEMSTLIKLRRNNPALRSESISIQTLEASTPTLIYNRTSAQHAVVVASNISIEEQDLTVELPFSGEWWDALTEAPVSTETTTQITHRLLPGETLLLKGKRDASSKN